MDTKMNRMVQNVHRLMPCYCRCKRPLITLLYELILLDSLCAEEFSRLAVWGKTVFASMFADCEWFCNVCQMAGGQRDHGLGQCCPL